MIIRQSRKFLRKLFNYEFFAEAQQANASLSNELDIAKMRIIVNGYEIEVTGQRVLIEELRERGLQIPSLCYNSEAIHQASCMVCMVKDVKSGQMIPSCSTVPYEGMDIDTESEEVVEMRKMGLELLLSDHRADCEAPCTIVCPAKIDVAQILFYLDREQIGNAYTLLASAVDVQNLPCTDCKAPCEKACRRGSVDKSVDIRSIIKELSLKENCEADELANNVGSGLAQLDEQKRITAKLMSLQINHNAASPESPTKVFYSKLGRYKDEEKEWLRKNYTQQSHCLHCACEGKNKCLLRKCASEAEIKSSHYGVSSHQQVKAQIHVKGRLYFEPAKCIRCGLCVYNSQNGFTFMYRGFDMQVVIPDDNKNNVNEEIADLCPTGALFVRQLRDDE